MAQTSRTRTLLYCLGAGVLYGLFNYLSSKVHLPGCDFVELRPQVALPMFMGALFGPAAGFLVGCLGDSLGYVFQGRSPLFAWNWSIGNGLIGAIPGLARYLKIKTVRSIRDYEIMSLLIVLAASLPIVFASLLDTLKSGISFSDSLSSLILPAAITDAIFGLLLAPGMMAVARVIVMTVETRAMLMINYLLLTSVIITYAVSVVPMWKGSPTTTLIVHDLYNIGALCLFVLLAGLSVSAFLARKVTAPVVSLADAATALARGDHEPRPDLMKTALRQDEMGNLAAVFLDMMRQVYKREEALQNEVRQLRIEIDTTRQAREVARITGADYFRELRKKARELRAEE